MKQPEKTAEEHFKEGYQQGRKPAPVPGKNMMFRTIAAAKQHIVANDIPDVEVRAVHGHGADMDDDEPVVIGFGIFPRRDDVRPVAQPTLAEISVAALRADLMTHVFAPHRYAWGRYYPLRATSALVAEGGASKSTITLAQQLHGAAGKPYLGAPTLEGLYIYLSCEDDVEIVERRAQKVLHTFTPEERAKALANFRLIDGVGKGIRFVTSVNRLVGIDQSVDRIIAAVRQVASGRPVMHLAVDTVSRVNAAEENSNEAMSIVEQACSRIAQALDCATTALHHVSKSVAREAIADSHAGRGAASFGDNMRSVLRLLPMTWKMVATEKLEGLDRVAVERGDVLKLIHAKLNQERRADVIYLQRMDNGLLQQVVPTMRTESEAADIQWARLIEWYKTTFKPFTITRAARTERLQWTRLSVPAATALLESAVADGALVAVGEAKGHAVYVPDGVSKSDPFVTET